MKKSEYSMILAAIYIAPHCNGWIAAIIAIYLVGSACVEASKE